MTTVKNGVPQGCIFGPLCFSLFIKNMSLAFDGNMVLFAGDTAIVITTPSLDDLYCEINKPFSDLTAYMNANKLVPNLTKVNP